MAYSFPLERIYLSAEFQRSNRMSPRIVGTLLDSAFPGPPRNKEIDTLLERLEHVPTMH